MNREPIPHKDSSLFRVISLPNGLWVAQERGNGAATKVRDPWIAIHSPTDRDSAIARMYLALPTKA